MHKEEVKAAKRAAEHELRLKNERIERVAVVESVNRYCRVQADKEIRERHHEERLMVVALLPTREYNARALMWRLLKVATCLVGVGYFGAKLPFMKQIASAGGFAHFMTSGAPCYILAAVLVVWGVRNYSKIELPPDVTEEELLRQIEARALELVKKWELEQKMREQLEKRARHEKHQRAKAHREAKAHAVKIRAVNMMRARGATGSNEELLAQLERKSQDNEMMALMAEAEVKSSNDAAEGVGESASAGSLEPSKDGPQPPTTLEEKPEVDDDDEGGDATAKAEDKARAEAAATREAEEDAKHRARQMRKKRRQQRRAKAREEEKYVDAYRARRKENAKLVAFKEEEQLKLGESKELEMHTWAASRGMDDDGEDGGGADDVESFSLSTSSSRVPPAGAYRRDSMIEIAQKRRRRARERSARLHEDEQPDDDELTFEDPMDDAGSALGAPSHDTGSVVTSVGFESTLSMSGSDDSCDDADDAASLSSLELAEAAEAAEAAPDTTDRIADWQERLRESWRKEIDVLERARADQRKQGAQQSDFGAATADLSTRGRPATRDIERAISRSAASRGEGSASLMSKLGNLGAHASALLAARPWTGSRSGSRPGSRADERRSGSRERPSSKERPGSRGFLARFVGASSRGSSARNSFDARDGDPRAPTNPAAVVPDEEQGDARFVTFTEVGSFDEEAAEEADAFEDGRNGAQVLVVEPYDHDEA